MANGSQPSDTELLLFWVFFSFLSVVICLRALFGPQGLLVVLATVVWPLITAHSSVEQVKHRR